MGGPDFTRLFTEVSPSILRAFGKNLSYAARFTINVNPLLNKLASQLSNQTKATHAPILSVNVVYIIYRPTLDTYTLDEHPSTCMHEGHTNIEIEVLMVYAAGYSYRNVHVHSSIRIQYFQS